MGAVTLAITSPQHDAWLDGTRETQFAAHVVAADPHAGTLYARWYSTLPSNPAGPPPLGRPPDLDQVALAPQSTTLTVARRLLVGSQAISIAVKDQAGDGEAALRAVTHAGFTGGGPGAPAPCIVHVLVADSRVPRPPAAAGTRVTVTRAAGLWAQAPPTWLEGEYVAVNRLGYRWTFRPAAGGAAIELGPDAFEPRQGTEPPRVGLRAIPPSVPAGDYTMTLQVIFTPKPPDPARSGEARTDVLVRIGN